MSTFAIIETGGKQYKVSAGDKIKIEKISRKVGESFDFDKVLLKADGASVEVGAPYLTGVKVEATVLRQARDKKKIVFRYHPKTRYRKKKGHRQFFTEVQIGKI
ncbi:MAG: 50S ribosomal protein L21 [Candidatus Liptonbacteria bacterium]|nr:50S ribosomal protein L21 [Candidatus Liptonbacteria bacterium]